MNALKPLLFLLLAGMILVKTSENQKERKTKESLEIRQNLCRKNLLIFDNIDILQVTESFLLPRESFQMMLTNKKTANGLKITGMLNVFPNESSVNVFRDMDFFPPKNEITWEDTKNLISDDRKANIEQCLRLPENERSNFLFDEVSRQVTAWDANREQLFLFYKEVLFALAKAVDPKTREKVNRVLMRESICFDAPQDVEKLIKGDMNLEDIIKYYLGGSHGCTALTYAADTNRGRLEIIRVLLDGGAKVNGQDMQGDTALHLAARGGNLEAVKFLVSRGAEVNAEGECRTTPLMDAFRNEWPGIESKKAKIEIIKLFLGKGAAVNFASDDGYTALIWAAMREENPEPFELLLNAGAEVNAQQVDGKSPLYFAAKRGKLNIVNLLLKNGVNVETKDANDKTAAEIAKLNEHQDCADAINNFLPSRFYDFFLVVRSRIPWSIVSIFCVFVSILLAIK